MPKRELLAADCANIVLRMAEPIRICEYDPEWRARFATLRQRLSDALGDLAAEIEHVGSTSVTGLAAKDTIDIVVLLRDVRDMGGVIERLEGLGYRHEGDFGVRGREAFATPPGYAPHDHHLYVCAPDWGGYADQLLFRDYLRENPSAVAEYAALKRRLAELHGDDRRAYTEGKTAFVHLVVSRARRAGAVSACGARRC